MITPTLFDVIAATKNVRDEQSPEIMQMIVRNRVFDPAVLYYLDGYMFVRDLLTKDSPDVVSFMATSLEPAQTRLDNIVKQFTEKS